jgi:hypothetical protein
MRFEQRACHAGCSGFLSADRLFLPHSPLGGRRDVGMRFPLYKLSGASLHRRSRDEGL